MIEDLIGEEKELITTLDRIDNQRSTINMLFKIVSKIAVFPEKV
jgi:hypothetical protein